MTILSINCHSQRSSVHAKPRVSQAGFSLIEVLVAILLVTVGLLGMAGLSGATFSNNKISQLRLTGISLVNDYTDRARINVYGYDLLKYNVALGDDFSSTEVKVADANLKLDPAVETDATKIANDLAAADVDQFLRSVRARLPQGDAVVISRPTANSRDLDIWLLWKEPQAAAGDTLFSAGKGNCPSNLTTAQQQEYNCMYFKAGL